MVVVTVEAAVEVAVEADTAAAVRSRENRNTAVAVEETLKCTEDAILVAR